MHTFQDEILKQSQGNAYNLPQNDGYQHKISSMHPPSFKPTAEQKESPHISTSPLYRSIKGIGASVGGANIYSKLKLLDKTPIAKAAPVFNLITGATDAFNEDDPMYARIAGGARGISGVTALLGMAGKIPAVAEVASLIAGKGAMASTGALASGSTALASAGAVLGAGAAGFGVGTLIDNVVGEVTSVTGISDYIDEAKGVKRKNGKKSGYKLSDLTADAMVSMDQSLSSVGDKELDYRKTLGYQIAEMFSDKKNARKEKETKELS